jgi:prepilin-type N-terminal cleavage/methylation domain-containing protein
MKRNHGFTLLEILLVVGIIAILAGIVIVALNPTKQFAAVRNTQRKMNLAEINKALQQYYIDYSRYPASVPTSLTEICNTGTGTTTHSVNCTGLIDLSALVPTYLVAIPVDPQGSTLAFLDSIIPKVYATTNGTGYQVMKDSANKVVLNAPQAENESSIAIGTSTPVYLASSGSVTQANMKISAATSSAFLDFSSSGSLTSFVGKKVIVVDHVGKTIQGYIKATGSGETFGTEKLSDPGFDNPAAWPWKTNWTVNTTPSKAILNNSNTSVMQYASLGGSAVQYALYLETAVCYSITASMFLLVDATTRLFSGTGIKYYYYTLPSAGLDVVGLSGGGGSNISASFTDISFKQVLTPSATGVTIVSTAGGTTYNWTSQESGFNYNDASGYTYQIYNR